MNKELSIFILIRIFKPFDCCGPHSGNARIECRPHGKVVNNQPTIRNPLLKFNLTIATLHICYTGLLQLL